MVEQSSLTDKPSIKYKKIAILHSIYQPYTRGGAEVVVENIGRGLRSMGHEVLVITVGYKNEMKEINGVKVYYIKPFNLFNFLDIDTKPVWLRWLWHPIDMFNDVQTWRVYKILSQEKPDLVLTHNLKGLGYYMPWLIKTIKIKQIHTVHDMQLIHPSGLLKPDQKLSFGARPYAWINKKLFNKVEAVIFPSEYIKSVYDSHGFFKKAEKIVLGNPIAEITNSKSQDPNKFKIQNSKLQILFLGQVEAYKGILDLIEAVQKTQSDLVLHIVGDGSALTEAKEKAGDDLRFKFYGRLSQTELEAKIWPMIDLLINPSQVPESFGMVIVEAMAHGVPALASNIGALPELIETDRTGWLFEAGNIEALSRKIEHLAQNLGGYQAINLLCQEQAQQFDLDSYLNKLIEFAKIKLT